MKILLAALVCTAFVACGTDTMSEKSCYEATLATAETEEQLFTARVANMQARENAHSAALKWKKKACNY